MGVTPEEVRRVAALAGLELEPGEVEALAGDLSRILEHVAALGEDEIEIEDRDRAGARASLDDDIPGGDPLARPPSSFAPGFEEGLFTVPRLASHGVGDPDGP